MGFYYFFGMLANMFTVLGITIKEIFGKKIAYIFLLFFIAVVIIVFCIGKNNDNVTNTNEMMISESVEGTISEITTETIIETTAEITKETIAETISVTPVSGKVVVPNVVNVSKEQAAQKLSDNGLIPEIRVGYSDSVPVGQVIEQSISAESKINEGSVVEIVISQGSKPYNIIFDCNGGINLSPMTGYSGKPFTELPTPIRDYYQFKGWYDVSGNRIENGMIQYGIDSITLIAQWDKKSTSGWTLASDMPVDAKIESEKWTYTETSTVTSKLNNMNGYNLISKDWIVSGQGTISWASFPNGYNTSDDHYLNMNHEQPSGYENENSKREIVNTTSNGWIYWHWADVEVEGGNVVYQGLYKRTISYQKLPNLGYSAWHAIVSTADYPKTTAPNPDRSGGLQHYQVGGLGDYCDAPFGYKEQNWTNLYFRTECYISDYIDYTIQYTYQKTTNKESSRVVYEGGNISNVQHWVKYVPK